MTRSSRAEFDVLIGGAGIAAAAAAVRLCALGFRPLILCTSSRHLPGIEAIPEAALPLFEELGMRDVLRQSNGMFVEGFENHWWDGETALRPGRWFHVERTILAKAAICHAIDRGAVLRHCRSLPKVGGPNQACVALDGTTFSFDAAIDATGRSAVWSRPIERRGHQLADVFSSSQELDARGRVVRLAQGWAYRIGLNQSTTIAIVGQFGAARRDPDNTAKEALGLAKATTEYAGRRPAFPQWSTNPICNKRIAIGDAALAYEPLAGQGIRFALSSAFGAAMVVNSWRHSPSKGVEAERFYLEYVNQSRLRHLQILDELFSSARPEQPEDLRFPEVVVFSGATAGTDLHVNSRIVTDLAVLLPDGAPVRWVGGIDLLQIRDLAQRPVRSSDLIQRLVSADVSNIQAAALLGWCLRNRLISAG